MNVYFKIAVSLLLIGCYCGTTSCNHILMTVTGIKDPKPKTDEEIIAYVQANHLDYDYIVRPRTDSELKVITGYMKIAFNTLVVYDNRGNEVQNTNDSTCHMKLRSQMDEMLKNAPSEPGLIVKNNKMLVDNSCKCLNFSNGVLLYNQELKPYVIFFSFATYIPIKKRLTDLDYISELKEKGLRDKVSVVLLDADIH